MPHYPGSANTDRSTPPPGQQVAERDEDGVHPDGVVERVHQVLLTGLERLVGEKCFLGPLVTSHSHQATTPTVVPHLLDHDDSRKDTRIRPGDLLDETPHLSDELPC